MAAIVIAAAAAYAAVLLFAWALCAAAGRADEASEAWAARQRGEEPC